MRFPLAASAALLSVLSGAASAAEPAAVEVKPTGTKGQASAERTESFTATVKAVDPAAHSVTLEWPGGRTGALHVSRDLTLDQLRPGDTVRIDVVQTLLLEVQAQGTQSVPLTAGSSPNATGIQGTVFVTGVDRAKRIVTFRDSAGATYEVKAGTGVPLEKLEPGQRLLATFVEAMAVRVEKQPK